MTIDDLIFVGRGGWALALHRDTGQIVWSNDQMKSGYTTLLLDGNRLIVSTNGYMYCLDPMTGQIMWQNPLTGYRTGVTTMVSVRGQSNMDQAAVAMQNETDDQAANHSASTNDSTIS